MTCRPGNLIMASNTPIGAPIMNAIDACGEADAQRQPDDGEQFGVGVANQRKRSADRANKIAHPARRFRVGHETSGQLISRLRSRFTGLSLATLVDVHRIPGSVGLEHSIRSEADGHCRAASIEVRFIGFGGRGRVAQRRGQQRATKAKSCLFRSTGGFIPATDGLRKGLADADTIAGGVPVETRSNRARLLRGCAR